MKNITREELEDMLKDLSNTNNTNSSRKFTFRTGQAGAQQFERAVQKQIKDAENETLKAYIDDSDYTIEQRSNLTVLLNSELEEDRVILKELLKYGKPNG